MPSITLTENAHKVLRSRYLLRDQSHKIKETPGAFFQRVAHALSEPEQEYGANRQYWKNTFYNMLSSLEFLPNSPTLMNAGLPGGQLSACFVLPIDNNLASIMETFKTSAMIQQTGGGAGYNFSSIPEGTSPAAAMDGPVSCIRLFNQMTDTIKQGSRRPGANMAILNADHPEIENFIQAKAYHKAFSHFNFSVGITSKFIKAVDNDGHWALKDPLSGETTKTLRAAELWNQITRYAWETGDPGLIFTNRLEQDNPTPSQGKIEATNPCGEVPLLPWEACNLGSVNLSLMTTEGTPGHQDIHWEKLQQTVHNGIRLLDNVIDANHFLHTTIQKRVLGNRKIGLGVMGWAEMLMKTGIPYTSDEAVALGEKVMKFIKEEARTASKALAAEKGAYPNLESGPEIRNATRTSIAPTGSISMIAGTTPGIEPLYDLVYWHNAILNNQKLKDINPVVTDYLRQTHAFSDEKISEALQQGNIRALIPEKERSLFSTAHEISYEKHIQHQAAFQKHTNNAVSKTINLPANANTAQIDKAYRLAAQLNLKGITVYRDQSKEHQTLSGNSNFTCCPT